MRFYNIILSDPVTGVTRKQYSATLANGYADTSALKVTFDIPFFNSSSPAGLAYIKIYGVNFQDIAEAIQLAGSNIIVVGGMNKGLPFANPEQQGLLLNGSVYQAFGNWQGNEISLDLIAAPAFGTNENPKNLSFSWQPGKTLKYLVTQVLNTAYPGVPVEGDFSHNLIPTETVPGFYYNIRQFSDWVNKTSQDIIKDKSYLGAQITQTARGFRLYDGSSATTPVQLNFIDFIGNATWTTINAINFKLVLRGDLVVGDYIKMPPQSNVVNVANSFTQFNDYTNFRNVFIISRIRHLGDSRQASADNWCTVVDALLLPANNPVNQ